MTSALFAARWVLGPAAVCCAAYYAYQWGKERPSLEDLHKEVQRYPTREVSKTQRVADPYLAAIQATNCMAVSSRKKTQTCETAKYKLLEKLLSDLKEEGTQVEKCPATREKIVRLNKLLDRSSLHFEVSHKNAHQLGLKTEYYPYLIENFQHAAINARDSKELAIEIGEKLFKEEKASQASYESRLVP